MVRRGVLTVLVLAGLAAAGYFAWAAGYDAGSAGEQVRRGHSFFWGVGSVFNVLLLLFLVTFISKIFFWRRGFGAHGGRWSRRWEEWHERYHREREEKGAPGASPESPTA